MTFRFTEEFQFALRSAALHQKRSQANLIEVAVSEFCETHGIKPVKTGAKGSFRNRKPLR